MMEINNGNTFFLLHRRSKEYIWFVITILDFDSVYLTLNEIFAIFKLIFEESMGRLKLTQPTSPILF